MSAAPAFALGSLVRVRTIPHGLGRVTESRPGRCQIRFITDGAEYWFPETLVEKGTPPDCRERKFGRIAFADQPDDWD